MTTVSNSSPICYLTLIEELHILHVLFSQVFIPPSVELELSDVGASLEVQQIMKQRPNWLKIQSLIPKHDESLTNLHAGERDAILLAEQMDADIVLLDERQAREVALSRGLHITGLLGVLDEAAAKKLLDLPKAIERLRKTSFRITPILLKRLLDRNVLDS